ncbi:hypothetical protein OQX63_20910 [Pedobacter sp. PF22-3]|uniref:hypothetical protein n=1 Tax=Pedobacter sp. PF22-3 TaxID=2994467 RepID=UPI002248140D|nr:hypothetical protein [Pedobacter sp. PF22-3]MCX2495969.1 hypothetical protein [Pedobacter sp. PF22-3]
MERKYFFSYDSSRWDEIRKSQQYPLLLGAGKEQANNNSRGHRKTNLIVVEILFVTLSVVEGQKDCNRKQG